MTSANIVENQVARQNQRITHSSKQCASRRRIDEGGKKLRRIGSIKDICFRRRRNETKVHLNLTLTGTNST